MSVLDPTQPLPSPPLHVAGEGAEQLHDPVFVDD